MLNQDLQNTRGEIVGAVHLFFADACYTYAAALAAGFTDYGQFIGAKIKPAAKRTGVKRTSRGQVYTAHSTGADVTLGLELTTTEIADVRKVRHLLLATRGTDLAQGALANVAIDPLVFTAPAPAVLNQWYLLTNTGVLVRNASAATLAVGGGGTALAAGDYVFDLQLGMVRFTNAANLPVTTITPSVTAPAITSSSPGFMTGWNPMQQPVRRGYARFVVMDQDPDNNLVMDLTPRPVELQVEGDSSVDGEKQSEMKLLCLFTSIIEGAYVRP